MLGLWEGGRRRTNGWHVPYITTYMTYKRHSNVNFESFHALRDSRCFLRVDAVLGDGEVTRQQ